MQNHDHILFDLDGTLVNTGRGIINAVTFALEQMGLPVPRDRQSLGCFVGPPLSLSFSTLYGLDPQQTEEAIRQYRIYYRQKGMWECEIYPGIPQLLHDLQGQGKTLMVATNKPEQFSVPILQKLGLAKEFALIAGADGDTGGRSEKHQVIQYGMDTLGITDPSRMVMVGDRKYDVQGANRLGIHSIGVLWGFGSRDELLTAGALAVAETPQQVFDLLTKRRSETK